jgi:DNA processing protein
MRKNVEAVFGKPFRVDGGLFEMKKEMANAQQELEFYNKNHIEVIDMGNSFYPDRLKNIHDPPIVIFACGNSSLLAHGVPVGIVGSRKASNSGLNLAYSVAKRLSLNDVSVVSGLASGIDSFAHRGALDGSGATIAVLGNGIDIVYPKENREVYERIKQKGVLVTEFSLGTRPLKWNFPKRNRIISGLSVGVLIVEAALTSGALITAQFALDQGREVMAFRGKQQTDKGRGASCGKRRGYFADHRKRSGREGEECADATYIARAGYPACHWRRQGESGGNREGGKKADF